ncbi:hypothetical protein D3C81_2259130 [compost metagenome]
MRLQGEQGMAVQRPTIGVQAEVVHQGIGGLAEQQKVIGIAQVTVVVDPVLYDRCLVNEQQIVHE